MRKVESEYKGRKDQYLILDSGEIPQYADKHRSVLLGRTTGSWSGGSTHAQFEQRIRTGDTDLVHQSDEFLAKIEDQVPLSRGWRNFDDVVGAVPNIPAFLAGHPQCMRRRERTMKQTAPLAIYMDLTSSAGISAKSVQKRGVTLLALTRLLVDHRPVELYVGTSLGDYGRLAGSYTTMWRIDTAPLDLARAAFFIGATVMSRGFGYGITIQELKSNGNWPFDNYGLHCETAKQRMAAAFPGSDLLYLPPIMVNDELVEKPVEWIKRVLEGYVAKEDV